MSSFSSPCEPGNPNSNSNPNPNSTNINTPLRETNGCTQPSESTTILDDNNKTPSSVDNNCEIFEIPTTTTITNNSNSSSSPFSLPSSSPVEIPIITNSPPQQQQQQINGHGILKPVIFPITITSTNPPTTTTTTTAGGTTTIILKSHHSHHHSQPILTRFTLPPTRILPKPIDPNNLPKLLISRITRSIPVVKRTRRRRKKGEIPDDSIISHKKKLTSASTNTNANTNTDPQIPTPTTPSPIPIPIISSDCTTPKLNEILPKENVQEAEKTGKLDGNEIIIIMESEKSNEEDTSKSKLTSDTMNLDLNPKSSEKTEGTTQDLISQVENIIENPSISTQDTQTLAEDDDVHKKGVEKSNHPSEITNSNLVCEREKNIVTAIND
jgi:hypothetical protein